MNQKGFITIALVILIVIFASTAGYFALRTPTPSPTQNQITTTTPTPSQTVSPNQTTNPTPTSPVDKTANWKTYSNNKVHVSLRYPPELTVEENMKYLYGGQVLGVAFYGTNKQHPEIQLAVYDLIKGGQKLLGLNADKNGETFESASQKMQKLAKDSKLKYEEIQANGISGFRLNLYGENTDETLILFGKDYVYLVDIRRNVGIDSSQLFNSAIYTGHPYKESEIFK